MTGEMIERVAKAIEDVDISFSIELTDLRDGVAHYTLRYRSTGESVGFGSHDEAYAYHADRLKCAQARAAIEAMQPPWQPIASAPRDGTPILIWVRGRFHEAKWKGEYGDSWAESEIDGEWQIRWAEMDSYGVRPNAEPTHWAPRPEPPPGLRYED